MKTGIKTGIEDSQYTLVNHRNHRKMMDVESFLHWVYQDQAADAVTNRVMGGLYPAGYGNNLLSVARNCALGGRVVSGNGGVSYDLHPDAEVAHEWVCRLPPLALGLLVSHAKGGTRPEIIIDATLRAVPVLASNGKPKKEYYDSAKRTPAYCYIRYLPEPDHVAFVHEVYIIWWDALSALAVALDDLECHLLTGPVAPREPWLDHSI